MEREPLCVNSAVGARLHLADLERCLPDMTDAEVRAGGEVSTLAADLYAGEMERRNLDE